MLFRNVMFRILKVQNCDRVGRAAALSSTCFTHTIPSCCCCAATAVAAAAVAAAAVALTLINCTWPDMERKRKNDTENVEDITAGLFWQKREIKNEEKRKMAGKKRGHLNAAKPQKHV